MKGQWGKLNGYFVGTLLVSAAVTFGLPLLGGGSWLPDLVSREGDAIDKLFWALLVVSLVIFAIVAAIVIYSITHFRAAPGDLGDGEHIHGNFRMELAWIIIPTIIVAVITAASYVVLQDNEIGLYDQAEGRTNGAATMEVDVRAFSFGWAFRYKDKDGTPLAEDESASTAELVLPKGEVVRFNVMSCSGSERVGRLRRQVVRELELGGEESEFAEIKPGICEREWDLSTSEDREAAGEEQRRIWEAEEAKADGEKLSDEQQKLLDERPIFHGEDNYVDVNHAFWVPEARLKIDAVYGLRTFVQWQSTKLSRPEDNYQVVCAELCGSGHNAMRTDMCVVAKQTFEWYVGLDEEGRRTATCTNLRMLSCIDGSGGSDPAGLIADLDKITKDDPDAGCDEAREAVA